MFYFTHFFAFLLGFATAIGTAVGAFYFIILKQIQKNESRIKASHEVAQNNYKAQMKQWEEREKGNSPRLSRSPQPTEAKEGNQRDSPASHKISPSPPRRDSFAKKENLILDLSRPSNQIPERTGSLVNLKATESPSFVRSTSEHSSLAQKIEGSRLFQDIPEQPEGPLFSKREENSGASASHHHREGSISGSHKKEDTPVQTNSVGGNHKRDNSINHTGGQKKETNTHKRDNSLNFTLSGQKKEDTLSFSSSGVITSFKREDLTSHKRANSINLKRESEKGNPPKLESGKEAHASLDNISLSRDSTTSLTSLHSNNSPSIVLKPRDENGNPPLDTRLSRDFDKVAKGSKADITFTLKEAASKLEEEKELKLKSGWVKMKAAGVWWSRFIVLYPDKLVYYTKPPEKNPDICLGIVFLDSVVLCQREEKKEKKGCLTFFLSHPQKKNIYSAKGLRGETLSSAKVPGDYSKCLIRVGQAQGSDWFSAFKSAIQKLNNNQNAITPNPESSVFELDDLSDPEDEGKLPWDIDDSDRLDNSSETKEKNTVRSRSGTAEKNIPRLEIDKLEFQESQSENNADTKRSINIIDEETQEGNVTLSKKELEKKRKEEKKREEQLKKEEKKEKSMEKKQKEKEKKAEREKEKNEKKLQKKHNAKSKRDDENDEKEEAPKEPEKPTHPTPKRTIVQYYKEGPMEFWTPKGYRTYWFIVKDGLLMYFDSEKASDSDGLVDLDNCYLKKTTPESETKYKTFEIHHHKKQPILLITNPPRDSQSNKAIDVDLDYIKLKVNSIEAASWIRTIEDILALQDQKDEPLFLPRHVTKKKEGSEEKCHWFNLFLNRYFYDLQNSETTMWMFMRIMTRKMERIRKPDWIGPIQIDSLSLGEEFLKIKEIFFTQSHIPNELIGEADISYKNGVSMAISTECYINWPKPKYATIPVGLTVKVKVIEGRVNIYGPPDPFSRFSVSFLEHPKCEFDVSLSVGRGVNVNLNSGKLIEFFVSMLNRIVWKNCVTPNRMTFALPLPGRKLNFKTTQLTSRTKQQEAKFQLQKEPQPQQTSQHTTTSQQTKDPIQPTAPAPPQGSVTPVLPKAVAEPATFNGFDSNNNNNNNNNNNPVKNQPAPVLKPVAVSNTTSGSPSMGSPKTNKDKKKLKEEKKIKDESKNPRLSVTPPNSVPKDSPLFQSGPIQSEPQKTPPQDEKKND